MWTACSSDRLHSSKQHKTVHLLQLTSSHHLSTTRLKFPCVMLCDWFSWIFQVTNLWTPPFMAISLSINAGLYTGPQDNITDRNHRAKGGGLTAIINTKFLTDATLFTDNVSNVAKHRMCTRCVSADYRNVCTNRSNSTSVNLPETKHLHTSCSHRVVCCLHFI